MRVIFAKPPALEVNPQDASRSRQARLLKPGEIGLETGTHLGATRLSGFEMDSLMALRSTRWVSLRRRAAVAQKILEREFHLKAVL